MEFKYDIDISSDIIIQNLDRITNQIFKLLPNREEGKDWENSLTNIIIELCGFNEVLNNKVNFLSLICNLEGMLKLKDYDDFLIFRKKVFECLSLITEVKQCVV